MGALFVMLTIASGLGFYNLSVYMNALVAAHGFPLAQVSVATAVFFLASGLAGLLAGRLIQRFDPRWTLLLGGVAGALAMLLLSRVTELWQLFGVYAIFGVGHALAGLVPATTLVALWFERQRSLALSVASTGLSVGGILLTPLSVSLIGSQGWSQAMPLLALAWFLGIVPVTWWLVRSAPESHAGDQACPALAQSGWSRDAAVGSRFFRIVTLVWLLAMMAQVGGISHLFNLVASRVDEAAGATSVAAMALASFCGRFLGGWLLLRLPARGFALCCLVLQAVAMLVLALAEVPNGLLFGAILFGFTVGNLLMLHPLLLAEAFGVRDYGRIFGLSQFVTTLGVAAGPAVLGLLHGSAGGYAGSFIAAASASTAGVLLLASVQLPDSETRRIHS